MMMKGIRAARLVGAAVGALLVSGSVVAITAYAAGVQMPQFGASPAPSPKPGAAAAQQYCQAYLGHLAKDLGKSTADVQKAAKQAFDETVDDAVKAGQLTKDQGTALKAKFDANQVCAGQLGAIGRGPGGPGGPKAPGIGDQALKAEAAVLGTNAADLMTQVKAGKTVKDLAAAKGMDEAKFRAAYVDQIKKDLAPLVTAGKLTQAQADAIAKRAETAPIPYWNGPPARASKPRTASG